MHKFSKANPQSKAVTATTPAPPHAGILTTEHTNPPERTAPAAARELRRAARRRCALAYAVAWRKQSSMVASMAQLAWMADSLAQVVRLPSFSASNRSGLLRLITLLAVQRKEEGGAGVRAAGCDV